MSWNIRVKVPAEDFWGDLEGDALDGAVDVVRRARDLTVARVQQLLGRREAEPAIEGEAPHFRTGALRDSVKGAAIVVERDRIWTRVLAKDPGAARLEFGDVDRRGIATRAHPFLRPAFEELEGRIRAMIHGWAETVRR